MGFKAYRSPMEREFADEALRSPMDFASLGWQPQYHLAGYELDFAIPALKVCVEIDGHSYHSSKGQRQRDAIRDRRLMALGWRVVRFTGTEVDRNPRECVRELEAIVRAVQAEESGVLRIRR